MTDDSDTIEVPREQFANHILPLALEGGVTWQCSDEMRDQLSITELADPRHVTDITVDEQYVRIFSEFTKIVSERVARATHLQPPEYKNHNVTVILEVTLHWPTDPKGYNLPVTTALVHQREYPTEPPAPDI